MNETLYTLLFEESGETFWYVMGWLGFIASIFLFVSGSTGLRYLAVGLGLVIGVGLYMDTVKFIKKKKEKESYNA